MNAFEFALVAVAALIVVAVVRAPEIAAVIGRLKRRARRTYTNVTYWQPPLVTQDDIDATWDEDWLSAWPADTDIAVMEQAVYDRLFRNIPEVAADPAWQWGAA